MTRRIVLFAFLFLLAFSSRADALHGAWTASRTDDGRVHLNITYGSRHQFGQSFAIEALQGLTAAQIDAATSAPVTFEIRRDAGTVAFRGSFERGDGAGHFDFSPNRTFFKSLESIGVAAGTEKQDDEHLLSYALLDLSTAYIRDMRSEGYDLDLEKYLSMRIFGVTRQVIAEYRRLGFDHIPYEKLIALRVHRVTPDYIEKMRAAGYSSLSPDELTTSRIHRATPEFIESLRAVGYKNLPFDDLIAFRIHRVTPETIRELHELGYDGVSPRQLVDMSIHRVTPEYIRSLEQAGYSNVPVQKLIDMKIRGIDADIVRKMR